MPLIESVRVILPRGFEISANMFRPTIKRVSDVYICKPPLETEIYNELYGVPSITSEYKEFVATDVLGNYYTVTRADLISNYMLNDGSEIYDTYLLAYQKKFGEHSWMKVKTKPTKVWACLVPRKYVNYRVDTQFNKHIYLNSGRPMFADFIVCTDKDGRPNFRDGFYFVPESLFLPSYETAIFREIGASFTTIPIEVPLPFKVK